PDRLLLHACRVFLTCGHEMSRVHAGLWRPHRRRRVRSKPRITGIREGTHGTAARGSDPMNHVCDVISAAKDLADLLRYGKKMVERGLVSAHAGNISKRIGNVMLISMRGSMLDELEEKIVEVTLDPPSPLDHLASSELPIHHALYRTQEPNETLHG